MGFALPEYDVIREGCQRSAAAVVPDVYQLVQPRTVVDVGGGEGWWASEFAKLGAKAVNLDDLQSSRVLPTNVEHVHVNLEAITAETLSQGGWDLAVCLEVAEHLTEDAGDRLIEKLAQIARVVLFSAAIPGQGGHGHINEQWPGYWVDRFYAHELVCWDGLRWDFWDNDLVEPWYRQNLLLFADRKWMYRMEVPWDRPADVVHPAIYGWRLAELADVRGSV